jgi:hypothetical protein
MAWARLDDGFFGHPKTTRVWKQNPGAVGLLVRMISYCAKYETDGLVGTDTVEMLSGIQQERDAQIAVLLKEGALHEHEDGFVVSDYLDYNPSREQINEKREADRVRKQKARG